MKCTTFTKEKNPFDFKIFISTVFLIFSLSAAYGQCDTDVFLISQAEVDGFSCTALSGSLTISGPDITNLNSLSSLKELEGSLSIVRTGLTDLSGLEELEKIGNHLLIEDNPFLERIDALYGIENLLRLTINSNPLLTDCCGLYPVVGNFRISNAEIRNNGMNCNSRLEIIEQCADIAPVDMELEMSAAPLNPDAFTFFTQTLTLTNNGPSMASDIEVHIPKPAGVVYQGGNEFTATKGALDTWNTFNWSINRLIGGESATIEINYYKLSSDELTFFAEVAEAAGSDIDSTPGNGTAPVPNEDDEAAVSTGISVPLPDLSLSNLNTPGSGTPGNVLGFTFDLKNTGTVEALGAYTIGAYLSTDNSLSNNDLLAGTIPTGNTPKGTLPAVQGAIFVPQNLTPGTYFLILKADVDEEITEQDETNNQVSVPVSIRNLQVVCTGDVELKSQSEINAFAGCEIIEGGLSINGLNSSADPIVDLSPLAGLREVTGFTVIQFTNLTSLEGLNNLEKTGSLVFNRNTDLSDISALGQLSGQLKTLVFNENFRIESIASLSGIRGDSMETLLFIDNSRLKNLDGLEGVTQVRNLDLTVNTVLENIDGLQNLNRVTGSILLVGSGQLRTLRGFSNLERVDRSLLIIEHPLLEDLNGLGNLKTIGEQLVVYNNDSLQSLDALSNLESLDALTIEKNEVLSNCCGIYSLLESRVITGNVIIVDNPAFCSSEQDILDNCANAGGDIDLELMLSADPTDPEAYRFFTTTAILRNDGPLKATGVRVELPAPAGVVYQGGNEYEASQGDFRFWGPQDWLVGDLEAGASASITINYYLLSGEPITFYGQVAAANENDADSTPGNGVCCSVGEDDEAVASINAGSAADLRLSNYNGPDSGLPGESITFSFDLNNQGTQVAIGTYTIAAFLSSDSLISSDDYFTGQINTGNTPVGTIAGVSGIANIPGDIPPGSYQLILAADFDGVIAESDEGNNLLLLPFSIPANANNRQSQPTAVNIVKDQLKEIVVERTYPNPAESFLVLEYSARESKDLPLVVYDARGGEVFRTLLHLQKGSNQSTLDISDLKAGMYYARFVTPYRHEAIRFVKVKR